MTFEFSSYSSAQNVPGDTQKLIGNCFNDLNWLSAFDQFSGLDIEPCHQLMTKNGVTTGFLPAYIEHESMCGTIRDKIFGRWSRLPILKTWGTRNAIVCTSPWGFYSGIECSENETSIVYENFLNHVDHIASTRKLSLSGFNFVPESSHDLRNQLQAQGYKPIPLCFTTYLKLSYDSFKEYIDAIPNGKNRQRIRSERKKAKKLSFTWHEEDNLDMIISGRPLHAIMMDLYNNTHMKHSQNETALAESFLSQLWAMDKENLRLCITRLDEKIVAFLLLRISGGKAHAFMTGRDYGVDNFSSYFNTCYYEPIIKGIAEKWNTIYFRPGVYQTKLRRGCEMEKLYLYIKGHNLLAQAFLNIYIPVAEKHFANKYSMPNLLNH